MSKRMTTIVLAALCALALSAIAASGASAGATAYTCVANAEAEGVVKAEEDGPMTKNTNEHCAPGSTGTFGMKRFTGSTTLTLTSLKNPRFVAKLFGATVELEATGVECVGCTGENKLEGGVMEVKGSGGTLRFTGVKVVGATPPCEVKGPGKEEINTQPLKFTTTSATSVKLEPVTPTLLAEFNIVGTGCSVAGTNIKVTGTVAGTLSGSTLIVNVLKNSGELTLEGERASLTGEWTVKGPSGKGLALTNTSP